MRALPTTTSRVQTRPTIPAPIIGLVILMLGGSMVLLYGKEVAWRYVLFFLLGACLIAIPRWRDAILFAFALAFVEGFARNWFTHTRLPLLMKDFVLCAVYAGVLLEYVPQRKRIFFSSPLTWPIVCIVLLSLAYAPVSPNLTVALVGVKTWLFYIPLMYAAYLALDSRKAVLNFFFLIVLMAVPISLFGVWQGMHPERYAALGREFRFWTAWGASGAAHFRATSTFSGPGQFGGFLTVATILCLALIEGDDSKVRRSISWAALVVIMAGVFASNNRWSWMATTGSIAATLLVSLGKQKKQAVPLLAGGAIAIAVILYSPLRTMVVDRVGTLTRLGLGGIFMNYVWDRIVITARNLDAFIGKGLGTAAPGSRYVWEGYELVESQLWVALKELGIVGVGLYEWLFVAGIVLAFRTLRG
ncbi:MAG TPA: hypothetical protein EYP85_05250, partial [Armatimonadetes bacterium]|nr:hypothetical protein [Armatimonadota bacterium]